MITSKKSKRARASKVPTTCCCCHCHCCCYELPCAFRFLHDRETNYYVCCSTSLLLLTTTPYRHIHLTSSIPLPAIAFLLTILTIDIATTSLLLYQQFATHPLPTVATPHLIPHPSVPLGRLRSIIAERKLSPASPQSSPAKRPSPWSSSTTKRCSVPRSED